MATYCTYLLQSTLNYPGCAMATISYLRYLEVGGILDGMFRDLETEANNKIVEVSPLSLSLSLNCLETFISSHLKEQSIYLNESTSREDYLVHAAHKPLILRSRCLPPN